MPTPFYFKETFRFDEMIKLLFVMYLLYIAFQLLCSSRNNYCSKRQTNHAIITQCVMCLLQIILQLYMEQDVIDVCNKAWPRKLLWQFCSIKLQFFQDNSTFNHVANTLGRRGPRGPNCLRRHGDAERAPRSSARRYVRYLIYMVSKKLGEIFTGPACKLLLNFTVISMFTGPLFEIKLHLLSAALLSGFQSSRGVLKSTE